VPASADIALYRIGQEALTNVLRHAGTVGRVDVVLRYRAAAVELVVRDDGHGVPAAADGAAPPRHGHGLVGMRERAAQHGGELRAGPEAGGGFTVTAVLPVRHTAVPA
jgi:signal transduction histidine kinase